MLVPFHAIRSLTQPRLCAVLFCVLVPVCLARLWRVFSIRAPLNWILIVMSLFLATLDPSGAGYSLFQHLAPVPSGVFWGLAVATLLMAAVAVYYDTLPHTAVFTLPGSVPDTTPFFKQVKTQKCVLRSGVAVLFGGPCALSSLASCVLHVCVCLACVSCMCVCVCVCVCVCAGTSISLRGSLPS